MTTMQRTCATLAAVAALLCGTAVPAAWAADGAHDVRVALFDRSSLMGAAMPDGNWGMMGQGGGWGMMGRQGGMRYGMGPMAIRVDQATIKPGLVHFDVTNWSRGIVHEMLVVAVDNADAPLPYDDATSTVPEQQIRSLGEVSDLAPNATGTLDLDLRTGTYLLICNVPGHYAAGMQAALTVTP